MAKEKQKTEQKKEEKIAEAPKEEVKEKKIEKKTKRTEAIVNGISLPMSTKVSVAICKFIKGKSIEKATLELGQVVAMKRAIPMKGEIPHRKGMMSGRYPQKAAGEFIKLLKSLSANAIANEIENPVITKAIANNSSRPFGRKGAIRRKRTHVMLAVESKPEEKK